MYPDTFRGDVVDKHGLPDPYRWLEDPDDEKVKEWVSAQNKVTDAILDEIPVRHALKDRLTRIYDYPKYGTPSKHGSRYFFTKNDGLQNQHVIYSQGSLDDDPVVFLDPNALSDDGTAALSSQSFSQSGLLFAYGVSQSGSDWQTVHVRDVDSGKDLEDVLEWVKFTSLAWLHDDSGFFYMRYPKPSSLEATAQGGSEVDSNVNQKVYFHRIGQPQSSDPLVFHLPEHPKLMFGARVSHDGEFVILSVHEGCAPENKLYYARLSSFDACSGALDVVPLIDHFEAEYQYVTSEGNLFYVKTNLDAPKNRIVAIDVTDAAKPNWVSIVPEAEDVLDFAKCVHSKYLVLNYVHDVVDVPQVHLLKDGSLLGKIPLPSLGVVSGLSGKKSHDEVFFKFESALYPPSTYRFSMAADDGLDNVTLIRETKIEGLDLSLYEESQVFYESKDGTKVPMFVVRRRDYPMDGSGAVYLYGYGGFNISIQPYFNPFRVVLMANLGMCVAIANIRGGSEYGELWHQGGIKENKQNVFDDFISAAEYLVDQKYTSPSKLCISGGSNGGLLVGACLNQRPDLFGCAVAHVGVLDMLRFHLFTIGHAWTTDYGCADNEEDFKYLIKYSPVHNVRAGKPYPATMLCTADHDDRVVPLHSYKFIATLQHTLGSQDYQVQPLVIRIETKAGHGAGKPTSKRIEEAADTYGFISRVLGLPWRD